MNKRTLIKSAFAGSLMSTWVPPLITVVSLPAHASTSCNDIRWEFGILYEGRCEVDHMAVFFEIVLFSDTQFVDIGVSPYYYKGKLDIYSTNPVHEISWKWPGERNVDIFIREPLPQNCVAADAPSFQLETLSPGTLFIVTECGTITLPLGPT